MQIGYARPFFLVLTLTVLSVLEPRPLTAQSAVPAASAAQEAKTLRAEVRGPKAIWVDVETMETARPLDASAWRLTTTGGDVLKLATVLPNTDRELLLVPAESIDIKRAHFLELKASGQKVRVRYDGWFRQLYSDKELGANVSPDGSETMFRVFAPRADTVKLYLYGGAEDQPQKARQVVSMNSAEDGIFEASVPGDLSGTYYDFTVHGPKDPGNRFYGENGAHLSDPYARVQMESYGKSMVSKPVTQATPLKHGRPAMEDVVAYEVHVQDFTDLLPISGDKKGTISGMYVPGLKNKHGEPIGFDYLVDLGINVVHLLPVQEYQHYPADEWLVAFKDDPEMQAQAIAEENYQWGYSTTHAFAIESRYRQKGTAPGAEQQQFRDLVQAFHDKGIAVIIDIVPNHTGEDMRGGKVPLNFNGFDKQYYYRTNDEGEHIGPYGNEVKTEDRPMVQRWIIDQAKYFVEQYGVDGFRIDLAGQIDEQTLIKLMDELPDDIIVYGEPWIDVTDPYIRNNPVWDWYKADAPITFFQDDARNAFKGSPFVLENKLTDRGYAGGNADMRVDAMKGLANDYVEEGKSPNQGLNYLDIHDNWALADRFAVQDWDGRKGVDAAPFKIAATLLFTSQGPIVIHGGTEIMRSKGSAKIEDVVKRTASTELRLKGRDDTYNQRAANQFQWHQVGLTEGPNDYANMHAFWKGLIQLRLSEKGKVFRSAEHIPGQYQWITPENKALLGYSVGGEVLVLLNVGQEVGVFQEFSFPPGQWRKVADNDQVNLEGLDGWSVLKGGVSMDMPMQPTSLQIWVRD